MEIPNDLITRKQLCSELGLTIQTIRNYEAAGMPVIHIGIGKIPRYELPKVKEWLMEVGKR